MSGAMTFRQSIARHLANNLLGEDAIGAVLAALERDRDEMRGRWDDTPEAYGPQGGVVLTVTLEMHAEAEALKWLRENKPQSIAISLLEARV